MHHIPYICRRKLWGKGQVPGMWYISWNIQALCNSIQFCNKPKTALKIVFLKCESCTTAYNPSVLFQH